MGCECGRMINALTGMEDEQPLKSELSHTKYPNSKKGVNTKRTTFFWT